LYIFYFFYKKQNKPSSNEGFTQKERFIVKNNADIYDDFYAQAYDIIHKPIPRVNYELIQIINETRPSVKNSVFLDIGSGTGETVFRLKEMGYRAYGIEQSSAMIRVSRQKYPNLYIIQGDIMDPMKYEKDTFTHILCTYLTIYSIQDKELFFRYCFSWLKTGGFLILHLVDRVHFNMGFITETQQTKPEPYDVFSLTNPLLAQNNDDKSITFNGTKYESNYNNENVGKNVATWRERFTDKQTGKIRENEHHFFMESKETILSYAIDCGFEVKKEINYKESPFEFMIILYKV
jgi:SAM-dependent methyltransferase